MTNVVDEGRQALEARGMVPLFPLPGVVLFPHAQLPLHIFEPRYRRMTADALASDRLIAVALLEPGGESGRGTDDIVPLACAGVIEGAVRMPDGRYVMRLRGIARVEILEFVQDAPYRIARIRLLEDRNEDDGPEVETDKHRLLAVCAALRHEVAGSPGQAAPINESIPFASAVNTLCQTLNMDAAIRIHLLEMDDVRERCRVLTRLLERQWEEMAGARSEEGPTSGDDVH
jgi:Lon protease-like protein